MQCLKYVEPLNPEIECKYGYERNICNKTSCLKGPDEPCYEEWGLMGGRCAGNIIPELFHEKKLFVHKKIYFSIKKKLFNKYVL